ncbi:MAG: flippase [Negativicutes bacterium]|nr:flippase [Negativicutes bacterium]
MNQRKAGISLSYLSIIFANIIGILYTPFLLRMLGPSEYGLYALALSVIAYLSVIDFGFGNATVRYTALYRSNNEEKKLPELWGMLFVIYGIISIIALILGILLSLNAGIFFRTSMNVEELERIRILMLLMTLNVTVSFPLSVFESIMIAYERFRFQRALQLGRTLLQPFIMIPLLMMGYKSIALVILITVLNIAYLLANLWYCLRKLHIKIKCNSFDIPLLREVVQYSFWVFLIMIVDKLYWNSGQIILGAVKGTEAVAVFAVGLMFKNYTTSFSTVISSVFLPKVTTMDSTAEINDLFIKIGRIQFVIIAFILSGFILFGKVFINLWAGEDYRDSYFIALLILIPLSVPLIQTLGMSILQARNKLKFRSYVYLIMAILCCVFSVPLAKAYGGIGCAISISVSLILCNVIIMNVYYHKKIDLDIKRFWKEIFLMMRPILLLTLAVFIINQKLSLAENWINFLLQAAIFAIFYLIVIYKWSINPYEKSLIKGAVSKLKMH